MEILIIIYTFAKPNAVTWAKVLKICNKSTYYNMKKKISYSTEVRDALMKKYGVARQAIWEACSFITRGKRAQSIRKDALAMGGRYIEEDFIPNCTFRRTAEGFVQEFAAGVVLTATGSDVVITRNGKVVAEYEEVMASGWGAICEQAQKLAETGMLDMAS